jgi:hypothetical protein
MCPQRFENSPWPAVCYSVGEVSTWGESTQHPLVPKVAQGKAFMKELTEIIEFYEDKSSGKQLFQIHELIPQYKIDRVVYREKSREGWFKEITSQDYFNKVRQEATQFIRIS